jgi:hypothetical protein
MNYMIELPLAEVVKRYKRHPWGKISFEWSPEVAAGRAAVIQSEDYGLLLQGWNLVTLLAEETNDKKTILQVRLQVGGGGIVKAGYGVSTKVKAHLERLYSDELLRAGPA